MQQNKTPVRPTTQTDLFAAPFSWQLSFWLIFGASTLVFVPQCLDMYLAPRFFLLSLSLLVAGIALRMPLRARADWRIHGFDFLMLGWYILNLASIFWAYSWSEAVFYSQKTALLFLVYWLVRQSLALETALIRTTLRQITTVLGWVVSLILGIQIGRAVLAHGLDNDVLYEYAQLVFGNKSLAADYLSLLLVLHLLLWREIKFKFNGPALALTLICIILALQTRTVYLALAAGGLLYVLGRAWVDVAFRPLFFRRWLPIGLLGFVLLIGFLQWKGGGSLVERLNPSNYLESATANERRFVWYKTNVLNADHFWWGVGNGSWKLWFPSKNIEGGFRLQEQNVVFTRAHNDYLEIRAEMGIVGVIWFCALFGFAFLAGLYTLSKSKDLEADREILLLLAGILIYGVIQYFDFPRERPELQAMLGLLLGWLAWRTHDFWQRGPGITLSGKHRVLAFFAACSLVFSITIGWYRMQGEMHNVNMLKAQVAKNYALMAKEAAESANPFYEYDDVALPLRYHEGLALTHLKRIPEAVAAFEEAYWMNPWNFAIANNYATALAQDGKVEDAIPLFEKTVAINPKADESKSNLAYLYMQKGDSAKAMEWYHRIDTIVQPQTEQDRQKNELIKRDQAELLKILQELQKIK
jgi:O-antigen ligase